MFLDPKKVIFSLGIHEGQHVADIFSGSGFFVKLASELVGNAGKVYALGPNGDLLKKIKNDLKNKKNVFLLHGEIESELFSFLPQNKLDVALVINTSHLFKDKNNIFKNLKMVLKPKGKVLLVDWRKDPKKESLKIGLPFEMRFGEDEFKNMAKEHGFKLVRNVDSGDHHYGMVLKREV